MGYVSEQQVNHLGASFWVLTPKILLDTEKSSAHEMGLIQLPILKTLLRNFSKLSFPAMQYAWTNKIKNEHV